MPLYETSQVGMTEYNLLLQVIDFQYFARTYQNQIPIWTLNL